MWIVQIIKIRKYERGLVFDRDLFVRMLRPGWHVLPGRVFGRSVERVSVLESQFNRADLDVIVASGELGDEARVLDLGDFERAIVTIDGRVEAVFGPGLAVIWTVHRRVEVEIINTSELQLDRPSLTAVLGAEGAQAQLDQVVVPPGNRTLLFVDGELTDILEPGVYAYWRGVARIEAMPFDRRDQMLEVPGQELMTSDRVTLRLNATLSFRVIDPAKAALEVGDARQATYRIAQLALRDAVASRTLDQLLADKTGAGRELAEAVATSVAEFGVEVRSFGIRDVILPGEMKEILNQVVEARKAAEADVIRRQQETAARRSQANTARIYDSNPTLMRLRELEVLETVAEKAELKVVLGEGGLKDRLVQLI